MSCTRGQTFLKRKEQYLNKGIIIPLISLLWKEASQSSLGWSSYLKDGPLARGLTFLSGVLSPSDHQSILLPRGSELSLKGLLLMQCQLQ